MEEKRKIKEIKLDNKDLADIFNQLEEEVMICELRKRFPNPFSLFEPIKN
jgi:hypothetical protein